MALLQEENGKLVYRFDGETLVIEPWGKNSLRVRSRIFGEPVCAAGAGAGTACDPGGRDGGVSDERQDHSGFAN